LRRRSCWLVPSSIPAYHIPRTCGYHAAWSSYKTRAELGGAVRNEFPLLIIETIKTPAARTMAVRGRVSVRTTGATVVVLIFVDWRVANVDDDNDDGTLWQKSKDFRGVWSTYNYCYYDYYYHSGYRYHHSYSYHQTKRYPYLYG